MSNAHQLELPSANHGLGMASTDPHGCIMNRRTHKCHSCLLGKCVASLLHRFDVAFGYDPLMAPLQLELNSLPNLVGESIKQLPCGS
mmetsp:Transcript_2400/g.6731  ORF Transcript_2400/g.6731 Transcript_2400/m.6731 type:complete len:87 (+) Transcript_2400:258-518(+)